jgi:hypothetical protein
MNQKLPKLEEREVSEFQFGSVKFRQEPDSVGGSIGKDAESALEDIKQAIKNDAFADGEGNNGDE